MNNYPDKKIIVLGSIFLFIVATIIPNTLATNQYKTIQPSTESETTKGIVYVGGSGPANYTTIQQALNNATEGDIIYVYDDSSPYYEHLQINTAITLIGENKATTIIDGDWSGHVINITANSITIREFTIQNGDLGIYIHSSNNTITDNNIIDNYEEGIYLFESQETTISSNTITDNEDGIELDNSHNNLIIKNNISANGDYGIEIHDDTNELAGNIIKNNNIEANINGIYLENSSNNQIIRNNFINNPRSASFINCKNTWTHNFWNKGRLLPKLILGKTILGSILLPWINMDWRPASNKNIWYKTTTAVIDTTLGIMTLELYYEIMPITTMNFKNLSDIHFFNGLVFHRVINDFVIQGGGYYPNGTHKESPFGPIPLETHPDILHVDGAISMARTSNPNSATSQFFICDTAQPHLDGSYAAFGKIIDGFEVLRAIATVETTTKYGLTNWPIDDIIINTITVENW